MLAAVIHVFGDSARLVRYLGRLMSDPRVPFGSKAKLLGAGGYVWLDGDLISDAFSLVPGLGYVDDLVLVIHGVTALVRDAGPELAEELWPGDAESFRRTMTGVVWLDDQLYGRVRGWVSRLVRRMVVAEPAPRAAAAQRSAG